LAIVSESLLLKHQLLIMDRPRARAPNLRPIDRIIASLGLGTFLINTQVTQYKSQLQQLFLDDAADQLNGTIDNPKWSGNLELTSSLENWRLRYGFDWIGSMNSYAYPRRRSGHDDFRLRQGRLASSTMPRFATRAATGNSRPACTISSLGTADDRAGLSHSRRKRAAS
jgi:hypothetical protein